ncbi:MAG: IPT/TIG domain-containing protein, partial [Myxococcota bacterium]
MGMATALWAACGDLVPQGATGQPTVATTPDTSTPDPDDIGEPDPGQPTDPTTLPLEIRAVDPSEGDVLGGIDVVITGRAFREGLQVFFDQTPVGDVFVIGPTTAVVRLPPHPAGRVDVTVAHPDYQNGAPQTLPGAFRYAGTIAVLAVDPAEGGLDGGDAVVVSGQGFTADARAFIGGRPLVQQAVNDDGIITGIAPPGPWGPADVQVVGFNGTAVKDDAYFYGAPPVIAGLTPISGTAGTPVVITGTGLGEDSLVAFGDQPAEVVGAARDGTQLDVVAPAGAGVVDLRVSSRWGVDVWPDAFGYVDAAADPLVLACTHLSPASGPEAGGTSVSIACRGLAYPELAVTFGAQQATLEALDAVAGRVTVAAPPGSGEVVVHVATAVAAVDVPVHFRYQGADAVAVTGIDPNDGPPAGGTRVVIHGRGFA